jgi:hypothetical protein
MKPRQQAQHVARSPRGSSRPVTSARSSSAAASASGAVGVASAETCGAAFLGQPGVEVVGDAGHRLGADRLAARVSQAS